jgi:hypothetical protein
MKYLAYEWVRSSWGGAGEGEGRYEVPEVEILTANLATVKNEGRRKERKWAGRRLYRLSGLTANTGPGTLEGDILLEISRRQSPSNIYHRGGNCGVGSSIR